MSVAVLRGRRRVFHWESASRPGVKRCAHRRTASPTVANRRRWARSSQPFYQADASSLLTNSSSSSFTAGCQGSSTLGPDTQKSRNAFVSRRMSSGRAARSEGNGATAAAREVKQYLNRTLFPRPSSTLHGYASLYHRLKRLPASHRKARQRSTTLSQSDSGPPVQREDGQSDCDEVDSVKGQVPSPARVEIHIYVPTVAATGHDEDAQPPPFSTTFAS